jgi:uncharacterized protein (TIGR04222 family)
MEFLLDNPLAMMDGIYFLILYSFVTFFSVTGLGYLKERLDTSYKLSTPAIPPDIDPFEIAYLRGGENELVRTLIFSLRQKGLIVIAAGDKRAYLRPAPEASASGLSDIERRTLDWIGADRDVNQTFKGSFSLIKALDRWTNLYQQQLEQRQLLMPAEWNAKIRRWKWTSVSIIVGLGGYKFIAALAHGNWNIIFTVLLLTGGLIAALIVGRTRRRTKLGDLYLDRLKLVFEPIKTQATRNIEAGPVPAGNLASVDPLLVSVGVFGAAALAGSLYPDYNEAFRKNQHSDASATGGGCGGSACGTGCSSGSTSGGSSCSSGGSSCGGSSCGSGCGGCGGGCGGS